MTSKLWDIVAVTLIAATGFLWGSSYTSAFMRTAHPDFGQTEFAAAVMLTCGRGFADPARSSPALIDFLGSRTDRFSCDQMTPQMIPNGVNFTQKLYRYLMTAVAWQWKWSGISWSGLAPLFGILFAVTLCAAYGLFRLAAPPFFAAAGVIPLAVSAHHLAFLPQLRDYAKAPFILLLILILARLVTASFSRTRGLALSAAFGLVLGIGFGFRNDLLINIPPFLVCLFLVAPGRWRERLRLKAACLATAAAMFTMTAWPILTAYASGSNTGHVAVLGLTSSFDASLGLTRPVYDIGPDYLDGYAATLINMRSRFHDGRFVAFLSPEYDAAAVGLVRDVARHWPADIFVRGLGATLQVLDFPFTRGRWSLPTPPGVTSPGGRRFYEQFQQKWVVRLSGWGPWLTMASIVLVGAASRRAGIALVFLLLYYGSYPSVQFSARHFFHLEFIAWWSLIFIVASLCRWLFMAPAEGSVTASPGAMRNAVITAVAMAVIVLGPVATLRAYQQAHVTTLIRGYVTASRSPLTLSRTPRAAGVSLITPEGLWDGQSADDPFGARYLAAVFSADGCPAATVAVTARYDAKSDANDFSFANQVEISRSGPTEWLVPAYYISQWSRFAGFEIPAGQDGCLKTVSRIEDPGQFPVLLDLHLAPGWERTSLFQRVAKWESAR